MNEEMPNRDVIVRDVRMPFRSMVVFMVKWALAAIPSLLILVFVAVFFATFVSGIVAAIFVAGTQKAAETVATSTKSVVKGDPAEAAYLDKVVVRNVRVAKSTLDEDGVWGEIKNMGDRTLREVEVVVYCLGVDGKPIFEKKFSPVLASEYTSEGPLKPGYGRRFGYKLDDAPSGWTKKVDVKVIGVRFQE